MPRAPASHPRPKPPLWPWLLGLALLGLGVFILLRRPSTQQAPSASGTLSEGAALPRAAPPPPEALEVPRFALTAPDGAPPPSGLRAEVPWGADGVGKGQSEDGYPGGPNSFTVAADGTTWVLDQFNHRMLHLGPDGKILGTRKLSLESPADVALGKDGSMAVIDRTRQNQVELFDAQGRSRGMLPLPGAVPGEPSELTRVFVDKDKVFAQRGEGGPLIPLGAMNGTAQTGADVNGQFSRDGKLLISAGITDYDEGRVWVSGADPTSQAHLFTREANLATPLEQILLFDSDVTGMMYLVVKATYGEQGTASTLVLCLDGSERGRITRMFSLPYPNAPLDTFRKFDVAPEGGLLAAEYTETGVSYRVHACR